MRLREFLSRHKLLRATGCIELGRIKFNPSFQVMHRIFNVITSSLSISHRLIGHVAMHRWLLLYTILSLRLCNRHLQQRILVLDWFRFKNARLAGTIMSLLQLFCILLVVHLLQGAHLFNLIQVDYKTGIHVVQVFDAFTTEDAWVLTAKEMFDALVVIMAEVRLQFTSILFIFKFDVCLQTFLKID